MSLLVTTTQLADRDIRNIASYIAADNPMAARQFLEELRTARDRVAGHPEIGELVNGYGVVLRRLRISGRFRRYLIFYRQRDESTLEIVRILHNSRDIARILDRII